MRRCIKFWDSYKHEITIELHPEKVLIHNDYHANTIGIDYNALTVSIQWNDFIPRRLKLCLIKMHSDSLAQEPLMALFVSIHSLRGLST